jgi:hypothetical protein
VYSQHYWDLDVLIVAAYWNDALDSEDLDDLGEFDLLMIDLTSEIVTIANLHPR